MTITATTSGVFIYTLSCVGEIPSLTQTTQAQVTVSAPAAGNSRGGGGSTDILTLLVLAYLTLYHVELRRSVGYLQRSKSWMTVHLMIL